MSAPVKRKAARSLQVPGPASSITATGGMIVRLTPEMQMTDEQFVAFCRDNEGLRIEQAATGELIIMPPVSSDTAQHNAELTADFVVWARAASGKVYDSSAGFRLPNKALRSPDVSWVAQARLDEVSKDKRKGFLPLCPDFVLELRSRTDRLADLQDKMAEFLANGARLGWLIDPIERQALVYRPDAPVEHLANPATLSGEPVLAGFTLDFARVW